MLSNAELAERILDEKNKQGGYISDDSDESSDSDEYTSIPKVDLDYFGGKVFFDEVLQSEKEMSNMVNSGNYDNAEEYGSSNGLSGDYDNAEEYGSSNGLSGNSEGGDIYSTDAQEIINEALSDSEELIGGDDLDSHTEDIMSASESDSFSITAGDEEYKCECCDECICVYKGGIKLDEGKCPCLCIECLGNKEQNIICGCCNSCANKEIEGGCNCCEQCVFNENKPNIDESSTEDGKLIGGYISEETEEIMPITDNEEIYSNEEKQSYYQGGGYISDDSDSESSSLDFESGSNLDTMINEDFIGGYISDETPDSRQVELFDVLKNKLPVIPSAS